MNVEPPETLVIIESILYKSNGFAIADFESAIRLDRDFAKTYFNRGVIRYKLREVQGAFEHFQKAPGLFKLQGQIDYSREAVYKIRQLWY